MVKYMNEYMILIVILIFLLLIYTIYILVDENSNQTEWERCNKILKRQERQIKIKKIKLFLRRKLSASNIIYIVYNRSLLYIYIF